GSDLALLRDHAAGILIATCHDIRQSQTEFERRAKAEGISLDSVESRLVDRASAEHARHRMASQFELWALVAEYRALRASVLRLWRESTPEAHAEALDDLTRFNESIDQSLTEAIRCFAEIVERDRQALLDSEQQAR